LTAMEKKPKNVRNLTASMSCPGMVNVGNVENDARIRGDSPSRARGSESDRVGCDGNERDAECQ
jgi:hypothetical protein